MRASLYFLPKLRTRRIPDSDKTAKAYMRKIHTIERLEKGAIRQRGADKSQCVAVAYRWHTLCQFYIFMLQEQFLKAADSSVDPSSRAMEEMLAAFERRIDKKIRVRICSKSCSFCSNIWHFAGRIWTLLCKHILAFLIIFLKFSNRFAQRVDSRFICDVVHSSPCCQVSYHASKCIFLFKLWAYSYARAVCF